MVFLDAQINKKGFLHVVQHALTLNSSDKPFKRPAVTTWQALNLNHSFYRATLAPFYIGKSFVQVVSLDSKSRVCVFGFF